MLRRNPDPGAGAEEEGVRVCPPHLARFRHASASQPRAWRPRIDTAVMYAWIYSTPPIWRCASKTGLGDGSHIRSFTSSREATMYRLLNPPVHLLFEQLA